MRGEGGLEDVARTKFRTFREAVQSTGHSIYWTDTTGTIQYVNPAFEDQTGFTSEEAIGNNANILQSGAHDGRFYERLWDAILDGRVWEGEIINQRKNGERYIVKQTISPITDGKGDIVRFVAINEDITDLRESQKQLERERNRFADLLDAVPVPMVLADFDRDEAVVKDTNQLFEETFGRTGQESGTRSLEEFIVDDADSPRTREIYGRLQRGKAVRREVTRRTAEGDQRTFLLSASPIAGEGSEFLATYIDVTDRRRTEEKLRRKTEELEDFAHVLSHDLRNPLAVAIGYLDLVSEECECQNLEQIRKSHARMQELIENILLMASEGKKVDEPEPVCLASSASRSWETVETANATLRIETARTVSADGGRLRQLFENLYRNAIEHGGDGVTVTVGDLDDGFYVADDGPGIPDEKRVDVFEAGHTSTDTGTGFGLSIVYGIAEAHGWTVTVTESAAGGARFEFTDVGTRE